MTKRHDGRSKLTNRLRNSGIALAALGMTGALAMTLTACDTVAVISFSERNFRNVYTSGFTPVPTDGTTDDVIASCMGVASGDPSNTAAGNMKLRFVLTDNDNKPIRAGETVDNDFVELPQSDVSFSDSALTEVSLDRGCASDADCSAGDGFACGTAPGLTTSDSDLDTCFRAEDEGLAVDSSVDFMADTNFHQVYGLLVQNSGSLAGYNPPQSGDMSWDSDGDGVTDTLPDRGKNSDIASDPSGNRKSDIPTVRTPWEKTATVAKNEGARKTYFGLWTFAGTTLNTVGDENNEIDWVRDPADVETRLVDEYGSSTATENRANVYESIQRVIATKYNTDTLAEYVGDGGQPDKVEKVLTVFVDGPDEVRGDNGDIEDVVAVARENNVRIFIVHLDPRINDPLKLREDPRYHEGQMEDGGIGTGTCSDDSECRNYEACRRPKGYVEESVGDRGIGEPTDFSESDTYCMLNRDEESGRIGPIQDYALLACATGGGYMYVPSAEAIAHNIQWTPYVLEGLWETTVHSAEVMRGNVPEGDPLLMHGNMSVTVAGTELSYPFNQLGQPPSGSGSTSEDFDTRSAIFTKSE